MFLYTSSYSSYRYFKKADGTYFLTDHTVEPKLTESELRSLKIQKLFVSWKDLFSTSEEMKVISKFLSMKHEA